MLFNLMRIRIQLPKIILIHADPDPKHCFLLIFYGQNVPLIANAKVICKLGFTWHLNVQWRWDDRQCPCPGGSGDAPGVGIGHQSNLQYMVAKFLISVRIWIGIDLTVMIGSGSNVFFLHKYGKKRNAKGNFLIFLQQLKKTQIISHIHYIKIFHLPSLLNFQFSRSVAVWYGSKSCSFFSFQDANKKYIRFFAYW